MKNSNKKPVENDYDMICKTEGCKNLVTGNHLFCESCRDEMEIEQFEASVSASN